MPELTTRHPFVQLVNNHAITTSVAVAEFFSKRHDHVLRAIDNLDCPDQYRLLNFGETVSERRNPSGGAPIQSRSFTITRDGFALLAMGFTGKEAMRWKIAYLEAFNAMEAEIARQQQAQQAAALPIISQPNLDTINRINQRAWNLAQASFEEYRARMMEDVLIKTGSVRPEDWEPVETSKEMIEMILATVSGLESMTKSLRRRAVRLEAAANCGKVEQQGSSGLRNKLNKQHK